jgi:hypothetical protein
MSFRKLVEPKWFNQGNEKPMITFTEEEANELAITIIVKTAGQDAALVERSISECAYRFAVVTLLHWEAAVQFGERLAEDFRLVKVFKRNEQDSKPTQLTLWEA